MTNPIPCARPKVTVDDRPDANTYIVRCHVPGCGFQYPDDLRYHALKSDAADNATRHRQAHRDAVPACTITKTDDNWLWVDCSGCGQRRRHSTHSDATAWRAYHLAHDHGTVTC